MVDTRFHSFAGPAPLAALLSALDLTVEGLDGDGPVISGAEELVLAGPEHISLAAQAEYVEALRATAAAAVIVSQDLLPQVPPGTIAIVARNACAIEPRSKTFSRPVDMSVATQRNGIGNSSKSKLSG